MKHILFLCILATTFCCEAVISGRGLNKINRQKPVVEYDICTSCARKFSKESLVDGFCNKCYCKDHRKLKTNGICRRCKAESMKKKGTAKCCICNANSKSTVLYTDYTSKAIEFYCIDHWCIKHNSHFQLAGSNYVCTACEIIKQQEEKAKEAAEKEAERQKEREIYELLFKKYELLSNLANNAWPERHCEIHKWKEIYAPSFGGDYYTEDAKAKYAQNYMKALELQSKGLLKCICNDNNSIYIKHWREYSAKAEEARKKLNEFEQKYMSKK